MDVPVTERPAHQQRVIAEKAELDERLAKLRAFLHSDTFIGLPEKEQRLLSNQAAYMTGYSDTLGQRIAGF